MFIVHSHLSSSYKPCRWHQLGKYEGGECNETAPCGDDDNDDDYDYDYEDIIIVDYYYHAIIIQPK